MEQEHLRTINSALDFVVPWGKNEGKKLSELTPGQLWGYTKMDAKSGEAYELKRNCQFIRSHRKKKKMMDKEHERVEKTFCDDAKSRLAECVTCGDRKQIPTKMFDRRARLACFECGGTMQSVNASALKVKSDDAYPVSVLAKKLKVSADKIYRAIHVFSIPCFKHGKMSLYSLQAVNIQLDRPEKGTSEKSVTCKKTFRNPAARRMHERDCEDCQQRIMDEFAKSG